MIDSCSQEANKHMRLARFKTFLAGNPGSVFIILFATLVLTCAYLLILGNPGSPNIDSVAILAYCFLTVGIVLQAVGFIRAKALGERV
jgi:hypothetical protein